MTSLYFFDIDKTLTRSKEELAPGMAEALAHLLEHARVALISGDSLEVVQRNVVERLPLGTRLENLFLEPTSGAALYVFKEGAWQAVYAETLSRAEADEVIAHMRAALEETGVVDMSQPSYGERVEYRGAQVTLSALGQHAPIEEKEVWDPDGGKKKILRDTLGPRLPDYTVAIGGSTSIDVTKRGVNKAYGVRRLAEYLGIPIHEMLYVGDALFPGGNDEIVKETGVATHAVATPEDTLAFIRSLS